MYSDYEMAFQLHDFFDRYPWVLEEIKPIL